MTGKLFWNQGSNEHGGICDLWDELPDDQQTQYRADPDCKPGCEFKSDAACLRRYTYKDPKFEAGLWDSAPKTLMCPAFTQWNNTELTCQFCHDGGDCNANC